MKPPSIPVLVWLAGLLTLLDGVAVRVAGDKPLGADILLLGALILIIIRLGGITRR